jgi:hypothetical protein
MNQQHLQHLLRLTTAEVQGAQIPPRHAQAQRPNNPTRASTSAGIPTIIARVLAENPLE